MGNDSWSPYSMQKYATHGPRGGGAGEGESGGGRGAPRSCAGPARVSAARVIGGEHWGADREAGRQAGRVMTVVSVPLLSSMTQRTDPEHRQGRPRGLSL